MTTANEVLARVAPEIRFYSAPDVVALTGCTYRQLDYWCSRGLVNETAHGSGSQREFTATDLEIIHHAVRLIRAGFTAPAACVIAAELVDAGTWRKSLDGLVIDLSYTASVPS